MKKIIKIILLTIVSIQIIQAQTPSFVPSSGLVAYWPLDSNLLDASVNTYDGFGSLYNYTSDKWGNANRACSFSAFNAYIHFANTPINTNGTYSLNYWMKLKSFKNYDIILDFHPTNICGNYPQIWEYLDSVYIVECNVVASKISLGNKSDFLNKWKMVTQLVKSDTTFIYIDGKLKVKFPSIWSFSTTADLIVANGYNSTNAYKNGAEVILDEIGLWNRLLTKCEIQDLYNSASLVFTSQPTDQIGVLGGNVIFSSSSTSSATTYRWLSNIGPGGAMVNLPSSGQYSGEVTNILTVSNLVALNNLQKFRCVITNSNSGCINISDTVQISISNVGITELAAQSQNKLEQNFPNPSDGITTIPYSISSFEKEATIVLTDIIGKTIFKHTINRLGNGIVELKTSGYESGIYYYTLVVDGQRLDTKKMLIVN